MANAHETGCPICKSLREQMSEYDENDPARRCFEIADRTMGCPHRRPKIIPLNVIPKNIREEVKKLMEK